MCSLHRLEGKPLLQILSCGNGALGCVFFSEKKVVQKATRRGISIGGGEGVPFYFLITEWPYE